MGISDFEINELISELFSRLRIIDPEWNEIDEDRAESEGWCISNGPNDNWKEIQRYDECNAFEDDDYALMHVIRLAEDGNSLHQKALLLCILSWQGRKRGTIKV